MLLFWLVLIGSIAGTKNEIPVLVVVRVGAQRVAAVIITCRLFAVFARITGNVVTVPKVSTLVVLNRHPFFPFQIVIDYRPFVFVITTSKVSRVAVLFNEVQTFIVKTHFTS